MKTKFGCEVDFRRGLQHFFIANFTSVYTVSIWVKYGNLIAKPNFSQVSVETVAKKEGGGMKK